MGLREDPVASVFAEPARETTGRRVSRRWQWLRSGIALSLLSHGAALKKFPQVLLYLPRVSLLITGCRAGSAGFWQVSWLQSSCDLLARRKQRDISRAQLEGGEETGGD